MGVCTANAETGTNGNAVLVADAGSATAWNTKSAVGGNTIVYDNTHAYKTLAFKFDNTAANSSDCSMQWSTAFDDTTDWYGRLYLYATANPSPTGYRLTKDEDRAGNFMQINSSGQIVYQDSSGTVFTFTTPITLNAWVRIEWHLIHSTTVGQVEIKLFNDPDSTTATETKTSAANRNTGANLTAIGFGLNGGTATTGIIWLDNIVAGAAGYVGPAIPINTVAPVASGTGTVGQVLSVTDGTWTGDATITYTYQWQRDGSNIGSATASSYTLVTADSGTNVRCVVTAANGASSGVSANSNAIAVTAASSGLLVSGNDGWTFPKTWPRSVGKKAGWY